MPKDIPLPVTHDWPERPNGWHESDYEGFKEWTPAQWAWEFLRRNSVFQDWVLNKAPNLTPLRRRDVARASFGLKNFKPFWEPFEFEGKRTKFITSTPQTWSRVTKKQEAQRPERLKIDVRAGEMLLRIPVWTIAHTETGVNTILENVAEKLKKYKESWKKEQAKKGEKVKHSQKVKHVVLPWLRLLDLENHLATVSEGDREESLRGTTEGLRYRKLFLNSNISSEKGLGDDAAAYRGAKEKALEMATKKYWFVSSQLEVHYLFKEPFKLPSEEKPPKKKKGS